MQKSFYVYGLYIEGCNRPFYIGKSTLNMKNYRFAKHIYDAKSGATALVYNKIRKLLKNNISFYERKLKILNSEQEAFDLEIKLISLLGKICDGTGCLYNISDGGDGLSGLINRKRSYKKPTKISLIIKSGKINEISNKQLKSQIIRKSLTSRELLQICDLYIYGFSQVEVGKYYDLGPGAIKAILKQLEIPLRQTKYDLNRKLVKSFKPEDFQEMKRLYEVEKWNYKQIGEKYGIFSANIKRHLLKLGVQDRGGHIVQRKPAIYDREKMRAEVYGWTVENNNKIIDMYVNQKMSLRQIGKVMNLSAVALGKRLKKLGIQARDCTLKCQMN